MSIDKGSHFLGAADELVLQEACKQKLTLVTFELRTTPPLLRLWAEHGIDRNCARQPIRRCPRREESQGRAQVRSGAQRLRPLERLVPQLPRHSRRAKEAGRITTSAEGNGAEFLPSPNLRRPPAEIGFRVSYTIQSPANLAEILACNIPGTKELLAQNPGTTRSSLVMPRMARG